LLKKHFIYLKDILIIGLTAFGGPQAHLSMMLEVLVEKRNYFSREEVLETYAVCQLLPGPGSTQTITALGLKRGGRFLAVLSLLIWILPACVFMSGVAVVLAIFNREHFDLRFLIFVQPMAIGFILFTGYRVGKTVIRNYTSLFVLLLSMSMALLIPSPFTFPFCLLGGALISIFAKEPQGQVRQAVVKEKIRWTQSWFSLVLFLFFLILLIVLSAVYLTPFTKMLENFYRFGSLTYGGGSVMVPMMFEQFVKHHHYIDYRDFMTGLAVTSAIPGPLFSFATFAGGMSFSTMIGPRYVLLGCVAGTVCIFLPSILLVFVIFPIWGYIKNFRVIRRSIDGINASATGLVFASAFILYKDLNFYYSNLVVIVATFVLLRFTKISAPVLVLAGLVAGFIWSHFAAR